MSCIVNLMLCYKLYNKDNASHPYPIKIAKKIPYDPDGNITQKCKQYSLHHLLSNCPNFLNKKSNMEHLCSNVSTSNSYISIVLFTSKFHCKACQRRYWICMGSGEKGLPKNPIPAKTLLLTIHLMHQPLPL